jgi:hypothetical protein
MQAMGELISVFDVLPRDTPVSMRGSNRCSG